MKKYNVFYDISMKSGELIELVALKWIGPHLK